MFGGYRGVGFALAGLAAALLIGHIKEPTIEKVLGEIAKVAEREEAPQGEEQGHYEPSITCEGECQIVLNRTPTNQVATGDEHPDEAKQTASEQQAATVLDLLAQRRMAHWQIVMTWVTAFGVAFVVFTLRAAWDANLGFKRSAEQQLTAYVLSEAFEVTQHFKYTEGFDLTWSFKLRNAGQTPAFDLVNVARCDWATEEEVANWDFGATPTSSCVLGPDRALTAKGEFRDPQTKTMQRVTGIAIAAQHGLKKTIWIRGVATYKDINGRSWRHDYRWRVFDLMAFAENGREERTRRIDLYGHAVGNTLTLIDDD